MHLVHLRYVYIQNYLFYLHTAYYLFHRQSLNITTHVSTVYAACGNDDLCLLNSTETNAELPIAVKWKLLGSNDNCVVNLVEIIHDCMPRRVDLSLSFTSHATHNLYLMVRNIIVYL